MKKSAHFITLGCRLNSHETEIMRRHSESMGLENAVIVNSCAVTGEAVRQTRQMIRRARRDYPDARIIVTGCAAQIAPADFARMDEVDLILGNEEKLQEDHFSPLPIAEGTRMRVGSLSSMQTRTPPPTQGFGSRCRAFVQIQNGCDHRCTFCVIPLGRGGSRSVPACDIVDRIQDLVARGYCEVVLTGVDLTAYGLDLGDGMRLGDLVLHILHAVPDLARLRLSSIDCIEADSSLYRAVAEEERLMAHFHLSLQSGDNMILKRMKRRHNRDHAISFCRQLRDLRPDIVFGADLIAGFPTESEEMFHHSLDLVDECGLTFLHVFPFSPRPDTPAARMPAVPGRVIRARAGRLREKGRDALCRWFEGEIGKCRSVLMESPTRGRTPHYGPVRICESDSCDKKNISRIGGVHDILLTSHDGASLEGHYVA